ncbi:MAG: zinc metallopeptidase [Dysgonamonadaceae bacterium]|jgi:Zn-dependent membrane protease YugP|nr:zinc metallopeptidase [Dysgonamonadaceae bacterium]
MSIYWILLIGTALAGWLVQWNLNSKFKKYSKIALGNGLTGKEVAEMMLRENGITDVQVVASNGILTDNYNPVNHTISLSEGVYGSYSVTAAAVAAHETGHAIQHAKAYGPLKMRSALVPVISFSSQWVTWVILGGLMLMGNGRGIGYTLLLIGILLYAAITLFSFITLPVEIDASRRALAWLSQAGITNSRTHGPAKEALKSAAYTYVVAALGSLATLIYYISILLGRRN